MIQENGVFKKRLAIIPARGGSKRIPKKNIKLFNGKPIIYYPIDVLINSNLFTKIHVSTEDIEIKNIVEKLGIKIDFLRPKNLSDDFTPIMPVIKDVIKEFDKRNLFFDEIWIFSATNPFLKVEYLKNCVKILNRKNTKAVMTVKPYELPIEWSYQIKKNLLHPNNSGSFKLRSQDLNLNYHDASMIYAYKLDVIKSIDNEGNDEIFTPLIVSKYSSVDIDDNEDWRFSEILFKNFKK